MIEPWELILHHTYSGSPGAVFDSSPGRGSHGTAVGLQPSDFVLDGHSNGSGAVGFRGNSMVRVDPTYGWDRVGALRAEFVFRASNPVGGTLLHLTPTSLLVSVVEPRIVFTFKVAGGIPTFPALLVAVEFADVGVDPRQWTTAAVAFDGFGGVQIALNGRVVRTLESGGGLASIPPTSTVVIGNQPNGSTPFSGLIDDVKIWRPNPTKVVTDVTNRIIRDGVTECWTQWGKTFRAALNDMAAHDSECPGRLAKLVDDAAASLVRSALSHDPSTSQALSTALTERQRLWASGDVAAIGPVLTRLVDALRSAGIDPEQNSAYRALISDHCFQDLMRRTSTLDCDPDFARMLSGGGR